MSTRTHFLAAPAVRRRTSLGLVGASVLFVACSEEEPLAPAATEEETGQAFVSDPTTLPAAAAGALATGVEVVYVSLSPGSVEGAAEVLVQNTANGVEETVRVVGGGFDPVPIPAYPGDNLRFLAYAAPVAAESARTLVVPEWRRVVPWRSPPIVVRSYPPRGKRDVPVSASFVVVFSEPVDEASVNVETFMLTRGGSSVAIGVAPSLDGLRVTIDPTIPLLPETEYTLIVAGSIQDHDGDRSDREVRITFSTGPEGYQAVLAPTDLCTEYPGASVATFEDANLENAVRISMGWAPWESLTCDVVAGVRAVTHSAPPWTSAPSDSAILSLVGIQNLTGLRKLVLANNAIDDLSPIANLVRLDTLSVTGGNGALSDIRPLEALTNLRYLDLNNAGGIADLSVLSRLSRLTELHIRNNQVVDLRPLTSLVYLRKLNLAANAIVDIGPLSALGHLTWLAVNDNLISDVSPLAGLVDIGDKLWINGNRLTDLSALGGFVGVTWLIANDNDLVDTNGLASMTSLRRVLLNNNPRLTDVSGLLANSDLVGDTIDLSNTSVTCTDVTKLRNRSAVVFATCGSAPVLLSSRPLADGRMGVGYLEVLQASGGNGVFTWTSSGGLPPGLALSISGTITGAPTAVGTWTFEVAAQSGGVRALATFTIVVTP